MLPQVLNNELRLYAESIMSPNSATFFYKLANLYNSSELLNASIRYMEGNFLAVVETDSYAQLDRNTVAKLVSSHKLHVYSEFQAAYQWLKRKVDERSEHVSNLLLKVRLPLLTSNDLEEVYCKISALENSEECLKLVRELRKNKNVLNYGHITEPSVIRIDSQAKNLVSVKQSFVKKADTYREIVYFEGCIYVFSYWYEKSKLTLDVYDLKTCAWRGTTRFSDVILNNFSACAYKDDVYLIGGLLTFNGKGVSGTKKCFKFETGRGKLSEVAPMWEE